MKRSLRFINAELSFPKLVSINIDSYIYRLLRDGMNYFLRSLSKLRTKIRYLQFLVTETSRIQNTFITKMANIRERFNPVTDCASMRCLPYGSSLS
jgi:hypothetical protein